MNRLTISLMHHPRMTLIMECSICKQPVDDEDQTAVQVRLFGAKQYSICIGCGQEVANPDRPYKTRWGVRYRSLKYKGKT
jgi:hypothetical protein